MPVKSEKPKQSQPKKKRIELEIKDIDALLERVEAGILQEGDYQIIKAMADCIVALSQSVDQKAVKIKKLLRMIFGASTEKKENVLPDAKDDKSSSEDGEKNDGDSQPEGKKEKKPTAKGHGRNGADDYTGATRIPVAHPDLKPNDPCPKCEEGKVYKISVPSVEIRINGSAPLMATIYELERFRCNLCGTVFTATLPKSAGKKKYDASAVAMIILLKYGYGLPFNRLASLEANLGVPLPSSTQWDVVAANIPLLKPVYQELIRLAAQADRFHNDDTIMKVLALIKENLRGDPERKGMFTTGIVAIVGTQKIALFFTGRNHAGENLNKVLSFRDPELAPPQQMCDALDRNAPGDFKVILSNCLTHARRNFVDSLVSFPDECAYVIDTLAKVYGHEKTTKNQVMSAEERLAFHQTNSGPLMDELHVWLKAQLDEKKVEPNSCLGDAIKYMLKRWDKLTVFLRVPGAPLDNNICERALKKAILHRNNSLFYKTEKGAGAGDIFHSLIHTCELSAVNPHDYLMALLNHSSLVQADPSKWMPWNYQDSVRAHQTSSSL